MQQKKYFRSTPGRFEHCVCLKYTRFKLFIATKLNLHLLPFCYCFIKLVHVFKIVNACVKRFPNVFFRLVICCTVYVFQVFTILWGDYVSLGRRDHCSWWCTPVSERNTVEEVHTLSFTAALKVQQNSTVTFQMCNKWENSCMIKMEMNLFLQLYIQFQNHTIFWAKGQWHVKCQQSDGATRFVNSLIDYACIWNVSLAESKAEVASWWRVLLVLRLNKAQILRCVNSEVSKPQLNFTADHV